MSLRSRFQFFWTCTQKSHCWVMMVIVCMFSVLKHCHTVFHSSCTILHSCQQCTRPPVSPPTLVFWFLIVVILLGGRQHLTVVLVCFTVMMTGVSNFSYVCWPTVLLIGQMSLWSFVHITGRLPGLPMSPVGLLPTEQLDSTVQSFSVRCDLLCLVLLLLLVLKCPFDHLR